MLLPLLPLWGFLLALWAVEAVPLIALWAPLSAVAASRLWILMMLICALLFSPHHFVMPRLSINGLRSVADSPVGCASPDSPVGLLFSPILLPERDLTVPKIASGCSPNIIPFPFTSGIISPLG